MDQTPASPAQIAPVSEPQSSSATTAATGAGSFAPQLAFVALIAPTLAAALALMATNLRSHVHPTGLDWPSSLITTSCLLIVAGFITALFGVVLANRLGLKKIFGLSITGLALNFLVVAFVVPVVFSVIKTKNENFQASVAGKAYLDKLRRASNDYEIHSKALWDARVMDITGVTAKEQLEPRKTLVRQFIAANDQFKAIYGNAENLYKDELANVDLPPAAREVLLANFRSRGGGNNEQVMKIRDADSRIGESFLGALDLPDQNWGKWTNSPEQHRIVFSEAEADKRFRQLMANLDLAVQQETQVNQQLANKRR